jgi:hypothetical protein
MKEDKLVEREKKKCYLQKNESSWMIRTSEHSVLTIATP